MMSNGTLTVLLVASLLLIAGCVADPAAPAASSPSGDAPSDASAAAGSETGALSITVTTTELQPVAGAQVALVDTDHSAFTDDSGLVTFNDHEPASYTVLVAKPGYTTSYDKGKVVDVLPSEVTEVKFILDPVEIISAENTYHRTMVVTGMVACAFWISVVGYNNNCGRGVYTTGGNQIANPNDKTIHPWEIENSQVQTLLLELKWTPSQAALGTELWGRIMAAWLCEGPGGQTCGPANDIENKGGKSPLVVREDEGINGNITKKINLYTKTFPYKAWIEVRPYCVTVTSNPPGPCTHNIMINQKYEGFATAFYGEAAPLGFSAGPT